MTNTRKFICDECGREFDWPKFVEEYRGEYWGVPAYETVAYSPCCEADFTEVTEQEEEE